MLFLRGKVFKGHSFLPLWILKSTITDYGSIDFKLLFFFRLNRPLPDSSNQLWIRCQYLIPSLNPLTKIVQVRFFGKLTPEIPVATYPSQAGA